MQKHFPFTPLNFSQMASVPRWTQDRPTFHNKIVKVKARKDNSQLSDWRSSDQHQTSANKVQSARRNSRFRPSVRKDRRPWCRRTPSLANSSQSVGKKTTEKGPVVGGIQLRCNIIKFLSLNYAEFGAIVGRSSSNETSTLGLGCCRENL